MLDYKLALELKESGFPFRRGLCANPCEGTCFPTLSELIEACGYGFRELVLHSREDGHKWMAKAGKKSGGFLINGKSPDEAVAKLYLALHKK